MKNLQKREGVQHVVAWLIAGYSRLVYRLTRWSRVGNESFDTHAKTGRPFIACFWHSRMILMPNFWRFTMPLHVLHSPHRDGQIMLRTLARFGMRPIIGSSSRGGVRALREMTRVIRDGGSICLTPDGPRGPRMRASLGIIALARFSGVPIIPTACSVQRGRTLDKRDIVEFHKTHIRSLLLKEQEMEDRN